MQLYPIIEERQKTKQCPVLESEERQGKKINDNGQAKTVKYNILQMQKDFQDRLHLG